MSSRSQNFHGIGQYAEQIIDLAKGKPAFTGRGKKPSNKTVLAEIASINKCKQGHFFPSSGSKQPWSCGWHTKTAVRKQAKQSQLFASVSLPSSGQPASVSHQPPPSSRAGAGPVLPKFNKSGYQSPTIYNQ